MLKQEFQDLRYFGGDMIDYPRTVDEQLWTQSIALDTPRTDIDRICQECSDQHEPPQAFVLTVKGMANRLLAIEMRFLELGQRLPWPGLPLLGATFDPSWGFSTATVKVVDDGSLVFELPSIDFHELNNGDAHGYRLCVMLEPEMPETIRQLATIRKRLEGYTTSRSEPGRVEVTLQQV